MQEHLFRDEARDSVHEEERPRDEDGMHAASLHVALMVDVLCRGIFILLCMVILHMHARLAYALNCALARYLRVFFCSGERASLGREYCSHAEETFV
jgi:hypothetical protein